MATSATSAAAAPFVRCLLPRPPSSTPSQKAKDGASNKRSRLVLLQHGADRLTTRLTASGPADADGGGGRRGGRRGGGAAATTTRRKSSSSDTGNNNHNNATSEDALYRLAGLRTPSESATRDLAGGLLALSALEEVVTRTGGRVVWVSLANHLSVPGGDGTSMDGNEWAAQFQRNGVTVDLASDAMGWDDSDDEEEKEGDGDEYKQDDDGPSTTHRCYSSRMDSLKTVLATIERAAASIASAEDGDGDGAAATRDVPVIFDSIVPLLSYHGSAKVYRFLQRLLGRGMATANTPNNIALSPVVVPLSIECIQPADMRRLEDEADAIVTLSGGEMRTMRRGGGDGKVGGAAGRLGTDVQQFTLEQNQLQKQQQTITTGSGYTSAERLVLLKSSGQSDNEKRKKVVVQRKTKDRTDTRSKGDESLLPTTEKLASMELVSPASPAPSASSLSSQRNRPTLQMIEKGRDTVTVAAAAAKTIANDDSQSEPTTNSGPRIFVQDDDPEFDDMDEEDLDDDLDL